MLIAYPILLASLTVLKLVNETHSQDPQSFFLTDDAIKGEGHRKQQQMRRNYQND